MTNLPPVRPWAHFVHNGLAVVIDALLRLIAAQNANALVLPHDEPPFLEKGGEARRLSMPALGEDVLAMVLEELTTSEQRAVLEREDRIEVSYALSGAESFVVVAERKGGSLAFTFRPAGAAPSSKPASPSSERSPTTSTPATSQPPARRPAPVSARQPTERATAVDPILQRAALEDASDVFFSSGRNSRIRIGGELVELEATTFDAEALFELVGPLDDQSRGIFDETGSLDLGIERMLDGHRRRYRVNLFRHDGGIAAALRPIRDTVPTLQGLGLPDDLYELTAHRHGLVLMTGTAGAGKSSTLAALIEHVNRTSAKHIITIEDPVEYAYSSGRALIHQREVGRDVESFSAGLRAALREAPDIILVGEMRDRDTISAALTAAETGHLVLSTLHCGHAVMALDRIIDVFPQHQQTQVRLQLANVLRAVVTQVLLPSTRPPERVPAYEKLVVSTAVATKIREGRSHQMQSEIHKGRGEGMVALEATLADLVRRRRVTTEIAMATAADPQLLAELLRRT